MEEVYRGRSLEARVREGCGRHHSRGGLGAVAEANMVKTDVFSHATEFMNREIGSLGMTNAQDDQLQELQDDQRRRASSTRAQLKLSPDGGETTPPAPAPAPEPSEPEAPTASDAPPAGTDPATEPAANEQPVAAPPAPPAEDANTAD